MTRHRILPLLLFAVCLAHPASAQINPFNGTASQPLTAEDLDALGAITMQMLDRPQLVVGSIETWHNDKTGASGVITVGSAVKRHNYSCRILTYQNAGTAAGPRALPTVRLTWCKTPDGWKIG